MKHKITFFLYGLLLLPLPLTTRAQVRTPRESYDADTEIVRTVSDGSAVLTTTAHSIKIVTIVAVISTLCFLGYFFWIRSAMPDDRERYTRARRWIFYNIAVVTVLIFATLILHLFDSVR
jgi:hypothetical protein